MPTTRRSDGGITYTTLLEGKLMTTQVPNAKTCTGCSKVWCHTCRQPKCYLRKETEWPADALNTTYHRDYNDKEVPHERVRHKDPYIQSLAPLSDKTTNRADFVPLKALNGRFTQSARLPIAHRPFDDLTTYRLAHTNMRVARHVPKAKTGDDYEAPFYGLSSYQADYIKKPIADRPDTSPLLPLLDQSFSATTTYRDDYMRKSCPEMPRRRRDALVPSANTANMSTYGADFVEKPFAPRDPTLCCENTSHPPSHVQLMDRAEGRAWTPCCSSCDERVTRTTRVSSRLAMAGGKVTSSRIF